MPKAKSLILLERIESSILLIRGEKVLLDEDLAKLYRVSVKRLLEAMKRNSERFPSDFVFQLSFQELRNLRSQIATSSLELAEIVGENEIEAGLDDGWRDHGGRRTLPYAFTEQGVAMLSSVLRSPRAVAVNVEIMRTFVRMRRLISSNADLALKLATLEDKYDGQFKIVFDAIRALMEPPPAGKQQKIGF